MGDFEGLVPFKQPRKVAELSPQAEHFKLFRPKWSNQEIARVVRVAWTPTAFGSRLAVVSGTKVGIWNRGADGNQANDVTLSKFKDVTQCVSWRNDGKLVLVGDAAGNCSVVEMETKKSLRRFRGHGDAVVCAEFASADRSRAATGGRDGRLRTWDVATGDLLQTIDAHSDCLKVLASGSGGPDAWVTAGYDGRVRLWDLRASDSACVVAADHGHPVEDGVVFPGGATFVSAGGPCVKVWDFAAGGSALQAIPEAHSKAVTAVSLDSQATVMLTASFDGTAKMWNTADMVHLWTYKLAAPATCAAWRPDDKGFAVGMDDGRWFMRQLGLKKEELKARKEEREKRKKRPKGKGELRGLDMDPMDDDEVVEAPRRKWQKTASGAKVDGFLRKFEYKKLVEHMVQNSTDPMMGFAIIDEMLQRDALVIALSELKEELLLACLRWFLKVFAKGDFLQHQLFEEALLTLMDHNACLNPPSTPELTELVTKLTDRMNQELKIQETLMETGGMFKSILLI